jgi:hypothetical protein
MCAGILAITSGILDAGYHLELAAATTASIVLDPERERS